MVLRRGTAGPGAAASVTSAHRDEQQQQQQPPRASRRGRNRSSSSPAAMVALGGAAALGLLLLAAGPADAYSLLPGGSRLPYSARAWGSFRHRLGLGGPRAGTPATAQAAGKPKTLLAPLQSATAPSPPKAAPEAGGPAPAPAELLMDELGDLELEIKTKIEADLDSAAKAIDSGLRQGIEGIEKGLKDTLNKAMVVEATTTAAPAAALESSSSAAAASESSTTAAVAIVAPAPAEAAQQKKKGKAGAAAKAVATVAAADDWNREAVELGAIRTGKLVSLWSNGDLSTFEFTKAITTRLNTKVQTAIGAKPAATAVAAVQSADAATYMEGGWARRGKGSAFFRTVEIWGIALQFLLKEAKVRKIKDVDEQKAERRKVAVYARDCLLRLGPTFIKFGQLLSTRIDILPKEYTEELALLQDNVPGFSGEIAKEVIKAELGRPVEELFDWFDPNPLAAASLGQVHRARFQGEELAIKIQRQGLRELFDLDLKNLKVLAILLDKFDPKSDGAARDWKSIYEESAKLLYEEIDYENEGRNAERFARDFRDIPWVKVPKIYWDFTSTKVLAMEYCPGIKVSDIEKIEAAGIDRKLLAKRSAESYLYQLCRHGFFHCDPHPGNVACSAEQGGQLIYYDFGMMDEFRPEVKKGLVDLIFSVYEGDAKATCDAMEDVGILRRGADRVSVEKIARFFLAEFKGTLKSGGKWLNELDKEEQKRVKASRRAQLGADLLSLSTDLPFKFPPTFTFVFRAFTSLDGIGKGLDDKYDLTRLAQPFLKELIELRDGSATVSLLKDWQKKLGWRPQDLAAVVQSPRRVAQIEDTLRRAEQGDLKLRVRVLESERAFKRIDIVQQTMVNAIMASMFLNAGIMLTAAGVAAPGQGTRVAGRALFALAGLFGLKIPVNYMKLARFDKASVELGLVQKA